eukprot:403350385
MEQLTIDPSNKNTLPQIQPPQVSSEKQLQNLSNQQHNLEQQLITLFSEVDLSNAKEFDAWNMLIQEFLKLLCELIEKIEDFDIELVANIFLGEFVYFCCALNEQSFLCATAKKCFYVLLKRSQDVDKVLQYYISRFFNSHFSIEKNREVFVKLLENIVLRAHHTQKAVQSFQNNQNLQNQQKYIEQLELLNAIKLLIVELVNVYVDDMIRVIRLMNERDKQMMIDLIEGLDQNPPIPFNKSKIAFAKQFLGNQRNYGQQQFKSFQNTPTSMNEQGFLNPFSISQIQFPKEEELFKMMVVNFEEGLQVFKNMLQSLQNRDINQIEIKDMPKFIQILIKNMFQQAFKLSATLSSGQDSNVDQNSSQNDNAYKNNKVLSEIFLTFDIITESTNILQQMLPQFMNAYFQLPMLKKPLEKLIYKTIFINHFNTPPYQSPQNSKTNLPGNLSENNNEQLQQQIEDDILKVLVLSKEVLEQAIDSLINLVTIMPEQKSYRTFAFEILIIILSSIESQLQQRVVDSNAFDEQTMQDQIFYKVEFKQVPFIEEKKNRIIQSNGDPIPLVEGIFQFKPSRKLISQQKRASRQQVERMSVQPSQGGNNIKSFDFIMKQNQQVQGIDSQKYQNPIDSENPFELQFTSKKNSSSNLIPPKPIQKLRANQSISDLKSIPQLQSQIISPQNVSIENKQNPDKKSFINNEGNTNIRSSFLQNNNQNILIRESTASSQITQASKQSETDVVTSMFPQIINKSQSMQTLQQAQYGKKEVMNKGPPHMRMKRYAQAGVMPNYPGLGIGIKMNGYYSSSDQKEEQINPAIIDHTPYLSSQPIIKNSHMRGVPVTGAIKSQQTKISAPIKGFSDNEWDQALGNL